MLARLRFGWIVFAGGAVLMALEILASRVLAPSFGSSVYVWGSIISVFLAALSAGYWWGGRLADRNPTFSGLGGVVTFCALALAVLQQVSGWVVAWLGERTGGTPGGTLLTAAVLFAPPSVLLATLSPYAIRLAARDLAHLGGTAGRLYALSTAGSLAGTLAATFLVIPYLDLTTGLSLLVAVTAATALVAFVSDGLRKARLVALLAVGLLVFALVSRPAPRTSEGLIYERATPYQTLRIEEIGTTRYLSSDRVLHGALDLTTGEPALRYLRHLPVIFLAQPDTRRVLILGMGSGTGGTYLRRFAPEVEVDLVDIDPAVPEVAERFLQFHPGPQLRAHVADGRQFLHWSQTPWDAIVADTYIGLSVPFHLTTREFVTEVERRLAPGGVFVVNVAESLNQPFPRAIVRTVRSVFSQVELYHVPGSSNLLVVATRAEQPLTQEELAARAEALAARLPFAQPSLAEIASRRLRTELDFTGVPVLEDRFAPVDRLIHLSTGAPPVQLPSR